MTVLTHPQLAQGMVYCWSLLLEEVSRSSLPTSFLIKDALLTREMNGVGERKMRLWPSAPHLSMKKIAQNKRTKDIFTNFASRKQPKRKQNNTL